MSHPHQSIDKETREVVEINHAGVDPNDPTQMQTMTTLASQYVPGSAAEKALLRKLDLHIIPCVWVLFMFNFLDRSNIGNAKTGGLEADFDLTSNQYSLILLVFFITYLIFEVPSNLILARVRPSLYLPGICIIWGAVAACLAACNNWKQMVAVRLVLGLVEAGFAPGVTFYLSSWYRRYEIARRFSWYFTAVTFAGALSGLLAGLITQHLDGARGIRGWRWLFIIEGVATVFVGMVVWFFMPDYPNNTMWLSPEERLLAAQRLAYDGLANTQGAHGRISEWEATKMAFKDWRTWLLAFILAMNLGAQTILYFVPTLVGALGWTSWEGQYHTIPLWACAFVCVITFALLSDHYKNKPFFIALTGSIGAVFFILTVSLQNHTAQYVCIIIAFGMVFGGFVLAITWGPNVIAAPAEKRAVAIAIINGVGNSSSIYGVFLWPKSDAPRYVPGFSATTAFLVVFAATGLVAGWLFKKYPLDVPSADEVVAAEIQRQREQGINVESNLKGNAFGGDA